MSTVIHRGAGGLTRTALANAAAPAMDENEHVPLSVDTSDAGLRSHVANATLANPLRVDPVGTTPQPVSQSGTWSITQTPATSGGLTTYRLLSAATVNQATVKGSAGQVYGWVITNSNAAARFVKLYNSTSHTVGSTTPVMTLLIPGNATGAGMVAAEFTSGIAFGTGIGIGTTTGVADADSNAVALNEVVVHLFYK